MSQAQAKKAPARPVQDRPAQAKPKLRVLPVLKLGVGKDMLERGPAPMMCRATAGGSCHIDCTNTTTQ